MAKTIFSGKEIKEFSLCYRATCFTAPGAIVAGFLNFIISKEYFKVY